MKNMTGKEQQQSGRMLQTARYTGQGLEYHTALQVIEYLRKALADSGYLGLSDHEMLEATREALSEDAGCTGIALIIRGWLEGEYRPFRASLVKVLGGVLPVAQPDVRSPAGHHEKADLLAKTYDIIEAFRRELAAFGWSWLRYEDVFQAARAGLNMNSFDHSAAEISDALRPVAWHIHVLLQERQYAGLRPILEAGLRCTPDDARQAALKAVR